MFETRPDVSVSIITYNQRDLIGRAIDSVLAQEVNFTYEIIIGDDCSDDGTQHVLREYQRRHPDKIQLILHPRRYPDEVPGRTNNTTNLLNCRGKYTAMLDGDDYWTSRSKLQRQYDRMEAHRELSMCLHDARLVYEVPSAHNRPTLKSQLVGTPLSGLYTHEDIAMRNRLSPFVGSMMYRTACLGQLPDWFYEVVAADFALFLHLSSRGKVYYDTSPDVVYSITSRSFQRIYRKKVSIIQQDLADIDTYAHYFPATRKNGKSTRGKSHLYWHLYQHFRKLGQYLHALRSLWWMLRYDMLYGISRLFPSLQKVRRHLLSLSAEDR